MNTTRDAPVTINQARHGTLFWLTKEPILGRDTPVAYDVPMVKRDIFSELPRLDNRSGGPRRLLRRNARKKSMLLDIGAL